MKRIYGVLGDYYHQDTYARAAIKQACQQLGTATFIQGKIEALQQLLAEDKPDILLIAIENRINPEDPVVHNWLTPELDQALATYVAEGGRLLALHAGLASYPMDSQYVGLLKGYFVSHPNEHCSVRYVAEKNTPLTNAPAIDYEILDEFYVVEVQKEATTIFMTAHSLHGIQPAGWFHDHGKGQVMCLVPTHNQVGYEHPSTSDLLAQAFEYLLGFGPLGGK